MGSLARAQQQLQGRKGCIALWLGIMLVSYLIFLGVLERSSLLQNSLWQLLSMGVFGGLLRPLEPLPGVPENCGNAAPLKTLSWMNPSTFNETTRRNHRAEQALHAPALNAPIFVVGCGHSGTTELINILNRHPLIYAFLDGEGMEFAVQPNSFASPWGWLPLRSHRDDLWFAARARAKSATHWAVKSPSNVCRLGYILSSLPYARIVMLVRDGRDTLVSLKERYPEKDVNGPYILGRWVNDNTAGLLYAQDPRVLIVRLEDFTHYPSIWLARILRHVGAPVSWQELDRLVHHVRENPDEHIAESWATSIFADRLETQHATESSGTAPWLEPMQVGDWVAHTMSRRPVTDGASLESASSLPGSVHGVGNTQELTASGSNAVLLETAANGQTAGTLSSGTERYLGHGHGRRTKRSTGSPARSQIEAGWKPVDARRLRRKPTEEAHDAFRIADDDSDDGNHRRLTSTRHLRRSRETSSAPLSLRFSLPSRLTGDSRVHVQTVLRNPAWANALDSSRSLIDMMLEPPSAAESKPAVVAPSTPPDALAKVTNLDENDRHIVAGNATWPVSSDMELVEGNPDLRRNHDELRRFQVSQSLKPVKPKWPSRLDEEDKVTFKDSHQAMKLLRYFGYAADGEW